MTTTTTTKLLRYDRTLGLSVMEGRGFYYPADTVVGDNGRLYVVNRSLESVDRGVRVTVCDIDSEYYGTFGAYGEGDGQFVWLTSGAKDSEGNIFLSDEYLHRITAFDADGNFLRVWGTHGSNEGELDGPCGIAFDADDNLYVSDTYNNRVQKFSPTGVFLAAVGVGTLTMPWGITSRRAEIYMSLTGATTASPASPRMASSRRPTESRDEARANSSSPPASPWTQAEMCTSQTGATSACRRSTTRATSSSFCAAKQPSPHGQSTSLASTARKAKRALGQTLSAT